MFTTLLLIGIPVLLILLGAVAALSFARDSEPQQQPEAQPAAAAELAPARLSLAPTVLFQPQARRPPSRQPSAAELVAALEAHLRQERRVAQDFTVSPSPETLWVN